MTIKIVHKNTSESDFLTFGTYFKKYGKRHDKHLHYYNVGESIGEDVEYNLGVEITSSTANSISDNSFSFAIGYNSGQVTGNTVALLAADDVNTWVNENSNYFSPTIILIGDDSSTSLGDRILNTSNNIVTVTNTLTLENTDNVGNYFNALQYDMNEIMSLSTDQYVTDRFSWQYFELDSINKSLYNNKYCKRSLSNF